MARVTSRPQNRLAAHLILFAVAIATASACRDQKPSGSYPLPEPVTSAPPRSASGTSARGTPGERTAAGVGSDRARDSSTASTGAQSEVIWDRLGQWSGKGSVQTESFTGESGALRIKWQTRAIPGRPEGTFLLTIHSAISGRPLQVAVDQRGPGGDTAYVSEDPRVFFAVVDATDLEWSFEVDEPVATRVITGTRGR